MSKKLLLEYEKVIVEQPFANERLTMSASGYVSDFYAGTCDRRIARAFARLVRNPRGSFEVRAFAYVCLLVVVGKLTTVHPHLPTFVIDEDVNWLLVERYESRWWWLSRMISWIQQRWFRVSHHT